VFLATYAVGGNIMAPRPSVFGAPSKNPAETKDGDVLPPYRRNLSSTSTSPKMQELLTKYKSLPDAEENSGHPGDGTTPLPK
jgi:hypothetical protein